MTTAHLGPTPNPLWFKDAIIYEIPIRAFRDSNGDGIGDIQGVISKLDYLSDLGVTALWLLPFYPSPLLDGGYDIADYTAVHPMYGTLADFRELLKQAHERGIRVITELVINHTSNEHPWFQKSRRSDGKDGWRDFYVWSDDPKRYKEARIIFKDFETSNWTWDPVAKAYFWHRFYHHQPDLNFDNPAVHRAVIEAVDFWFELGVDGLRLDAIPYLYEREGTNSENLPETHAFLKKLRAHIDAKFSERMLLAEANQWPEDAAAYFGSGDECHMNFHFPLMPRMFMAVQMEDRFPIVDILQQTPAIPDNCQWATFLRNHDELTLEMVTDEERDYMYKVYAEDPSARINLGIRRRLAPLLKTRPQIELMMGLLFSLPGTPVLYYGDEIGMGDNIYLGDRDGVRTPMQWNADRNAGFSSANPQKLFLPVTTDPEYRYESVNVESQQRTAGSLLWWTKRLIALRKQHPALGQGTLEFLQPENGRVLSFLRTTSAQAILVVANLSRKHQWVELDLQRFEDCVPVELSGNVPFPPIEGRPYVVALAPHGCLWFSLEDGAPVAATETATILTNLGSDVRELLATAHRIDLQRAVDLYIAGRRWFRSKDRQRLATQVLDVVPLDDSGKDAVALCRIEYGDSDPEVYVVPLGVLEGREGQLALERAPHALIVYGDTPPGEPTRYLFDSLATGSGLASLLAAFTNSGSSVARLTAQLSPGVAERLQALKLPTEIGQLEQTNTTLVLDKQILLKVYRRLDFGLQPEIEIGLYLADKNAPAPRLLGRLDYHAAEGGDAATVAVLHEYVPNEGNAWELTLNRLQLYLDQLLVEPQAIDEAARDLAGGFLPQVALLGERTAQLHLALAGEEGDKAFGPEPFSIFHEQSIYQRAHAMLARTFQTLSQPRTRHPASAEAILDEVLPRQAEIDARLRRIVGAKVELGRIRCHGDLHLGQVLYTGSDFSIIDFEGEPARPLHERRYKRCPLRDVMGLVRSFDYAVETSLRSGRYRDEDLGRLRAGAEVWQAAVTERLLEAYLTEARGSVFLPRDLAQVPELLAFFELEKVIYEVRYEMQNRPDWLEVPLRGLLTILNRPLSG